MICFSYSEIAKEPIWELWHRGWWRRLCWNTPYRKGPRHYLCVWRGNGRSHTFKHRWVEELPRWQESSCWTGHPYYYQEHQPSRLEDDDRHRYHLNYICVWLLMIVMFDCYLFWLREIIWMWSNYVMFMSMKLWSNYVMFMSMKLWSNYVIWYLFLNL